LSRFRLRLAGPRAGWAAGLELLSEENVSGIVENFGAIVSAKSLLTFIFPSDYLRTRIADLFVVICELRARFGR
jgi:hypothetical protein